MHERDSSRQPLRLLAVVMGLSVLTWLIARTGAGAVIEHAKAVGWGMILILALGGISNLVRTLAWRFSFRSDIRGVSLARTFALRLISEAIGNFGLAGQVVGDSMRISLLGPLVPITDRISSVALDRGLYVVTAGAVSVLGIFVSVLLLSLSGAWRFYSLLFAAGAGIVLLLMVVSFGKQWRILSRATEAMERLPWARKWLRGRASVIQSVEENFLTFHSQAPKSFWIAVLLHVSSQLMAIAEVYLLLRFMGVPISFIGALVIEAFTKVISIVGAVNPGNIGTYEGGNVVLARMLTFAPAAGLTLALCRRARTLFWAGIGALCLVVLSRGKEQSKPEAAEGPQPAEAPESQATGEMYAKDLGQRDAPSVIIVVENEHGAGVFIPALARVGALPVLLRVILSARQVLQPARIVVSVPPSMARDAAGELRRTGRLPKSVEWRERLSASGLSRVVTEVADSADRIVLLSGTTLYKPALLQTISKWTASSDAVVFKAGAERTGMCCLSKATALKISEQRIGTLEELETRIEAQCDAAIAPTPREEWQALVAPGDCVAAEDKLDRWMFKPTDGRFARFNRRISIPISRQLIKTPITPNAVTFIILAVSVVAGIFFARGGYWNMVAGALLSVWASILDGCDGEVARFKLQSSKFGCWLDTICDYLYYVTTFAGIAWGLNRASRTNSYLRWGAVLVVGMLLSFFVVSWLRRRMAAAQPDKFLALFQSKAEARSSNPLLFLARNTEFIIRRCFFPYALLVAALLCIIKPVFIITAISANLVWTVALYCSFVLSRSENDSARISATDGAGCQFQRTVAK